MKMLCGLESKSQGLGLIWREQAENSFAHVPFPKP